MTDLSALIDKMASPTDAAWLAEKRDELNAQGVMQMRGLCSKARWPTWWFNGVGAKPSVFQTRAIISILIKG